MELLRRCVGIPVPRVIAWNSRASTHEVRAEFILMEKTSGRTLRDVVDESPLYPPEEAQLVRELTKLQKKILAVRFAGYGTVYFSRDISKEQGLSQFLAPDMSPHSVDSEFYLGPMSSFHHFTENALAYLPQQSNLSESFRDLGYCKKIIPFLVLAWESLSVSVLWHPDLHTSNVLVEEMERDDNGNRQFNVVSILDWGSTWAGPMFL